MFVCVSVFGVNFLSQEIVFHFFMFFFVVEKEFQLLLKVFFFINYIVSLTRDGEAVDVELMYGRVFNGCTLIVAGFFWV